MGGIFEFVVHHFAHVAPILGAGAIGLVVILERTRALYFHYAFPYSDSFFEKIRYLVMTDRIGEAIGLCESFRSKPFVQVVKEGVLRAHQPESVVENGLQIIVNEINEKLTARTNYLATIANVATLFGLFGTIIGLVQSFEAVGSANAQERATLLAQGISTAMNATMLGLGVAIPCMIAYSILIARQNRMVAEIERAAVRVLDVLKQRYYANESGGGQYEGERPYVSVKGMKGI